MSEQPHDPAGLSWHWDKRIPIALVVTIIFQTFGLGYWAATLSGRITALEETSRQSMGQDGRLIRVETQVQSMQQTLQNVDRKLDRLIEGSGQ